MCIPCIVWVLGGRGGVGGGVVKCGVDAMSILQGCNQGNTLKGGGYLDPQGMLSCNYLQLMHTEPLNFLLK